MFKKVLGVFVVLCLSTMLFAQTADEVVAKFIEGHGGYEILKAVNAMKITGTRSQMGMDIPFIVMQKRPNKMHVSGTFQGMSYIQAFDGETGWSVNPFMGDPEPQPLPENQQKRLKDDSDIDGPLVDYKEKGHQVEVIGKEEMEGSQVIKIQVTLKSGDIQYWYLDAEYFIELKVVGKAEEMGQTYDVETTFSDYKDVGGMMIAHATETKINGNLAYTMKIDKVEINIPIDDSQFVMPKKEQ